MQVGMHQAKTELSQLIERVLAGEQVIVARNGKPVAQIIPYTKPKRELGKFAAQGFVAEDWDSDETNAQIAKELNAESNDE